MGVDFETLRKAAASLKGEKNRSANLGAIDALERYIKASRFKGAVRIEKKHYALSRDILVPVNPPFVLTHSDNPVIFWPSFWKTPGRLDGIHGAVFASILDAVFFSKDDFIDVDLEFLDLSSIDRKSARSLRVYKRSNFPRLSEKELRNETDKFVVAFRDFHADRTSADRSEAVVQEGVDGLPLFQD
jgi:hypothetical protein